MENLTSLTLTQTLNCLKNFLFYVVPCVICILPLRFVTKIPSYIFRKILHLIAFTCTALMVFVAESWQAASSASLVITVVLYPLLALLESRPWFANLFVQKSRGEIKRSFLMLFLMCAAVTCISWGILGHRDIAAASILMWGTGDAAAALAGIPFGKHKVHLPHTDGKKSWEGTSAMVIVSLTCGVIFFLICRYPLTKILLLTIPSAIAGAATELFSSSETDTVTVPSVIMIVLAVLIRV